MTKRILIVEDNPDNRILITDVLASMGFEVLVAVDGSEGVNMAVECIPHLILMDLSLPVKDGWTAAAEIKANAALKHIPIIALTAHAMVGDREKALKAGCDDYISKPIDLRELTSKMKHFLDSPTPDTSGEDSSKDGIPQDTSGQDALKDGAVHDAPGGDPLP